MPRVGACLALDDVEHLDGAVGRARREAFSIVVQLGIVLRCGSARQGADGRDGSYNHVLMGGLDGDRVRDCGRGLYDLD